MVKMGDSFYIQNIIIIWRQLHHVYIHVCPNVETIARFAMRISARELEILKEILWTLVILVSISS